MITIAVLDGPVDLNHSCFEGANLTSLPTLVPDGVSLDGQMSSHGTHVASIIFGQPGSGIAGIAPQCRGLIVPIFADDRCSATQLDMARAIEQAANAGAQVINISGGQLTDAGESDGWLINAVRLCQEKNILIVAAAGNDGCDLSDGHFWLKPKCREDSRKVKNLGKLENLQKFPAYDPDQNLQPSV